MEKIWNYHTFPVLISVLSILPFIENAQGSTQNNSPIFYTIQSQNSTLIDEDHDFNDIHSDKSDTDFESIFSPKASYERSVEEEKPSQLPKTLGASFLSATNLSLLSEKKITFRYENEARVLSIDGGGIKGLLVLELLALMEQKTGKHTTELFDMIGGTSAGALIATLLTIKDPKTKKPKFTARSLKDALMKHYPNFFVKKCGSCCGIIREKYKITPARNILTKLAGDALFGEAIIPTFVTAFNVSGKSKYHKLSILGSYQHNDKGKTVIDAALSSMSAPVFFKPHESSDGNIYLDGGLVANNPSLLAYCQAKKYFQHASRLLLLSMGVGSFAEHASSRKFIHTGLIDIGPELPEMFLLGQQSITQETLHYMPDVSDFRIDPILEGDKIELDDTSRKAMDHLSVTALRWWGDNPDKVDEILKRLTRS
jgi:hypothetical protein